MPKKKSKERVAPAAGVEDVKVGAGETFPRTSESDVMEVFQRFADERRAWRAARVDGPLAVRRELRPQYEATAADGVAIATLVYAVCDALCGDGFADIRQAHAALGSPPPRDETERRSRVVSRVAAALWRWTAAGLDRGAGETERAFALRAAFVERHGKTFSEMLLSSLTSVHPSFAKLTVRQVKDVFTHRRPNWTAPRLSAELSCAAAAACALDKASRPPPPFRSDTDTKRATENFKKAIAVSTKRKAAKGRPPR